jgi:hypothetical protein
MNAGRLLSLSAVVMVGAMAWWVAGAAANDTNQSREEIFSVYRLEHANAQSVAKGLNELLGGREDVRIEVDRRGNRLVVMAAEQDRKTLWAFLKLIDRPAKPGRAAAKPRSKLLFPEEVERAMMGEGRFPAERLPHRR